MNKVNVLANLGLVLSLFLAFGAGLSTIAGLVFDNPWLMLTLGTLVLFVPELPSVPWDGVY